MSDLWTQVKTIFAQAVTLSGEARRAFLEGACANDAALLAEVTALLEADEAGDSRLDRNAVAAAAAELVSDTQPTSSVAAGDRVGVYRLLERIGEGGMGEVWLAEQSEPIRRTVAVKVIKTGMDTRQVIARFEAERQALALMDHPAIAKVFDAGSTASGRPYFAMELVHGVSIAEHCDRHELSNRERLELFLLVCDGVQHAHQKGVIHRDLKPTNVVVSLQDGKPVPKIIDFGIAKATGMKLANLTAYTEVGILMGTPGYMSPEQVENQPDIDTRADVYALGVLLYELLVGALPFDPEQLRRLTPDGIAHRIREEAPSRPSRRLAGLGERATISARHRQTTPPLLRRELMGDLDVIVMKALQKERGDRYASAAEFAGDIRRYLSNQPILARPPSAAYQLRKMFQRNRLLVGATGAVLLVVIGSSIVTAILYLRAQRDAARARTASRKSEQVVAFLTDMLASVGPSVARGRDTTMLREVLDRTSQRIGIELRDQPEVEADLQLALGQAYEELTPDDAVPHLERAVKLYRESAGDRDPATLRALHELGEATHNNWYHAKAIPLLREALAGRRAVLGPEHPDTLRTMVVLASALGARSEEADPLLRAALAAQRRVLGPDHPDTLATLSEVGQFAHELGRYEECLADYRSVIDGFRRQPQVDELALVAPISWAGVCLRKLGRLDEALANAVEALALARRVYGEDAETTCLTMSQLASIYLKLGRPAEAEPLFVEAIAGFRKSRGPAHELPLYHTIQLGRCLTALGRYAQAEALLLENHKRLIDVVGADGAYADLSAKALAELYEKWGGPRR